MPPLLQTVLFFAVLTASATSLGAADASAAPPRRDIQRDNDLATLFERLRQRELDAATNTDLSEADDLLALQRDDGWFADLTLVHNARSGWEPQTAMARLRTFVRAAHHPDATDTAHSRYRSAAIQLLDIWLAERPQSPNWWFNQIGVPQRASQVYPLIEPWLSAEQRDGLLEIIGQARLRGEGANLLWAAELQVQRGTFLNEPDIVVEAAQLAAREVHVTDGEGIQVDGSFHQHAQRLQQYHYGQSMLHSATSLATLLHDTRFAFSEDRIRILIDVVLDGHRWMQRGGRTIPPTQDRAATRKNATNVTGFASVADDLATLSDGELRRPLQALAQHLRAGPPADDAPARGLRYYWRSDFAAWHSPDASFFVKTLSDRTLSTEQINSENLRGEYLNAGDHYLLRRGDEYDDTAPVWDWQRLPGITAFADSALRSFPNRSPLAGGVSDGAGGAVAFEFVHRPADAQLTARKAWFFDDAAIVGLGAGIEAAGDSAVLTTLNQSRLHGPVVAEINNTPHTLEPGQHALDAPDWIWHDQVGYLLVAPAPLRLTNDAQQGDWHRINEQYDDEPVELEMFTASIDHGQNVDHGRYAYIMLPDVASPDEMPAHAKAPPAEVVANDPTQQVIQFADTGRVAAIFYEAGTVTLPTGRRIDVDRPCAVTFTDNGNAVVEVHVADMRGDAGTLTLQIDAVQRQIDLPEGQYAGQPVSVPW